MGMIYGDVDSKAADDATEVTNMPCGEAVQIKRHRTNSEETALILTSMSKGNSQAGNAPGGGKDESKASEDEDFSANEADEQHHAAAVSAAAAKKIHQVQQINFDGPQGSKLDFLDDAGFSHRFRNESNRVKSLVTKHISIDELRAHFDRPIIDVAKDFGICITLMKKICRRNGIKRWPHRQIRSLSKSIASMEAAMLSSHGAERDKYRDQIENLKMKRDSVIADPNKENAVRVKTPSPLPTSTPTPTPTPNPIAPLPPLSTSPSSSTSSRQNVFLGPPVMKLSSPSTKMFCSNADADADAGSGSGSGSLPCDSTIGEGSFESVSGVLAAMGGAATGNEGYDVTMGTTTSASSHTGHSKGGRWTSDEHAAFLEGIRLYGKDWRRVSKVVKTRSAVQTRTHAQKYLLKFAGRFPFETEADLVVKEEPKQEVGAAHPAFAVRGIPIAPTPVKIEGEQMPRNEKLMAMILNSASPEQADDRESDKDEGEGEGDRGKTEKGKRDEDRGE